MTERAPHVEGFTMVATLPKNVPATAFNLREIAAEFDRLGRPLTADEARKFLVH